MGYAYKYTVLSAESCADFTIFYAKLQKLRKKFWYLEKKVVSLPLDSIRNPTHRGGSRIKTKHYGNKQHLGFN